jgi:hypothetical protein
VGGVPHYEQKSRDRNLWMSEVRVPKRSRPSDADQAVTFKRGRGRPRKQAKPGSNEGVSALADGEGEGEGEDADQASTVGVIGECVRETEKERDEKDSRMQAYEMEARVSALVSERMYELRDEIADELIGSTEFRDAIANELIRCVTALMERTMRTIADRYTNENRPMNFRE